MSPCYVRTPNRFILATAVLIVLISGCSPRVQNQSSRTARVKSPPPFSAAVRTVYAYSLIPGGVGTAAAFGIYRASDKVLLDHFQDMGARIIPTRLARDKWMYSSYRIANVIYWTKNRVLIKAGERLLTDGDTLVRGRCGNRLSESPERPTQTFQPPPDAMDTVTTEITEIAPPDLIPADLLPQIIAPFTPEGPDMTSVPTPVPTLAPPDSGVVVLPMPVPLPPDTGGQVAFPQPPIGPTVGPLPPTLPYAPPAVAPTIPTPEMSTWVLMFTGLFGMSLGVARKLRRKNSLKNAHKECRIVL